MNLNTSSLFDNIFHLQFFQHTTTRFLLLLLIACSLSLSLSRSISRWLEKIKTKTKNNIAIFVIHSFVCSCLYRCVRLYCGKLFAKKNGRGTCLDLLAVFGKLFYLRFVLRGGGRCVLTTFIATYVLRYVLCRGYT